MLAFSVAVFAFRTIWVLLLIHEEIGILYVALLLKSLCWVAEKKSSSNHIFLFFKPPCGVPWVFQQSLSKRMLSVFSCMSINHHWSYPICGYWFHRGHSSQQGKNKYTVIYTVMSMHQIIPWYKFSAIPAVEHEGVRPSIAPCLGVEFPPGHSIREAEVSRETLLCPDRLGLQQWLTHNSSTQHWGIDSGSITTTTNNPSISMFCQEAVGLFVLCSEWYEHLIAQFSPALETCLPLHVCRRELWDPLVALSHMKRVLISCLKKESRESTHCWIEAEKLHMAFIDPCCSTPAGQH